MPRKSSAREDKRVLHSPAPNSDQHSWVQPAGLIETENASYKAPQTAKLAGNDTTQNQRRTNRMHTSDHHHLGDIRCKIEVAQPDEHETHNHRKAKKQKEQEHASALRPQTEFGANRFGNVARLDQQHLQRNWHALRCLAEKVTLRADARVEQRAHRQIKQYQRKMSQHGDVIILWSPEWLDGDLGCQKCETDGERKQHPQHLVMIGHHEHTTGQDELSNHLNRLPISCFAPVILVQKCGRTTQPGRQRARANV
eukprot:7102021-Prymnesium_polylepis.2